MKALRAAEALLRFRRPELDPVKRRLQGAANVEDLRRIARRRLPSGVFDYIDGAAEDERTAERNVAAFAEVALRPKVLRDVSSVETTTELFGKSLSMPLVLSPTGFTRIADPQGELAVARSAKRAGIAYTLSTLATRSIEEVAAVTDPASRNWFQVYVWRDRGLVAELLERAASSGYEAIVLTVDSIVLGRRERDVRRGFTLPPQVGPGTLIDGILHPAWTHGLLTSEPITFANLSGSSVAVDSTPVALSEYISAQYDQSLSWADLEWFRSKWHGPIVLKGVQRVDDALQAQRCGVDAIAISNHGGRQLDDTVAPIMLVEPMVQALGGSTPVLCDGGVRRPGDLAKALALGATACMAGRAYLYALGAAGEQGVDFMLAEMQAGLRRTMTLLGACSIDELRRDLVTRPLSWDQAVGTLSETERPSDALEVPTDNL